MEGLVKSARVGDFDDVVRRVSRGEDVNKVGPQYNLTPLHLASLHGHLEIVEFLLDNGADPNMLDDWRCTPLHNAAGAGHVDVVKELCEAGAKTDIRSSNKGRTAVEIARDKGKFDVIPVIQFYMSRNSRNKNPKPNADEAQNVRGVGGARENSNGGIVMRRKDANGDFMKVQLPGQIEENGFGGTSSNGFAYSSSATASGSRDGSSTIFAGEKRQLQKQLQELERQEQIHRLNSEHSRTVEQLEMARSKYDRDLEDLMARMQEMQVNISSLAGQRDSELASMEKKLMSIQERMQELDDTNSGAGDRGGGDRGGGDRGGGDRGNGDRGGSYRRDLTDNRSGSRGRGKNK